MVLFPGAGALVGYCRERHAIYERRAAGEPPPWTNDSVLRQWRFTNVYRELDRVTTWLRVRWREPHADDPDLWFAMVLARLINWPPTLAAVGYPVPWNEDQFIRRMAARRGKVWTGAYMVRSDVWWTGSPKHEYVAHAILDTMWRGRERLRPQAADTLSRWHTVLMAEMGMGSFTAAQVVADMKHVPPLLGATDWTTFAASGPGSRRGLNRVMGRRPRDAWREDEWRLRLADLREATATMFVEAGMVVPDAQDLQNCLCEWDKYSRVKNGEGRPRAQYIPHTYEM